MRIKTILTLALAITMISTLSAQAGMFTLVDGNSTADINTESQDGMYNWTVDGVDHLFSQWFWYRVGDNGPEASIDTLNIAAEGVTDTDFDGDPDTMVVRYDDSVAGGPATFEIQVRFSLAGGPAGSSLSDIAEQITLTNLSGGVMDINFFQYSDFDLAGTIGDDSVTLLNPNAVRQSDGSGLALSETVVTPSSDHFELAQYSSTLDRLNDGVATTLDDVGGTVFGDATWAFEWDLTLDPNEAILISKDKSIQVPAPGALLLAGLGLPAIGWLRRKMA